MNGPTIVARSAFGVQPTPMKKAVKMPHAMRAGMFGMIMPDKYVPKRWTPTRVLLGPFAGADAVVMAVSLFRVSCDRACGLSGRGVLSRASCGRRVVRGQSRLGDA